MYPETDVSNGKSVGELANAVFVFRDEIVKMRIRPKKRKISFYHFS
ncbi:hypothetical protein BSM4216_3593 [Bacillus smithii]|nr:hypothetical protein BSM4216_3593 [Bacillus smithii]